MINLKNIQYQEPEMESEDEIEESYNENKQMDSMEEDNEPPPPPQETEEEIGDRSFEIAALNLYLAVYKEELISYKTTDLTILPIGELKKLRIIFDKIVGVASGNSGQITGFFATMYLLERVATATKVLNCNGLTATLCADDVFKKDLARLSLKYLSPTACLPEFAVGVKLITTIASLDERNERLAKSEPETIEKVETVNSKFEDL